jgi:nitrite reductase/ring-hydroxylating ferredoxin subunit
MTPEAPLGRGQQKIVIARVSDIPDGSRLIVDVLGRSVGIFNIDGKFYALLNRCPHRGGELCKGDILGLVVSDRPGSVTLDKNMKLLACPWHGWEYDIETGQSWYDPAGPLAARSFDVSVEGGASVALEVEQGLAMSAPGLSGGILDQRTRRVKGPYTADVIPIEVENDYILVSMRSLPRAERAGTASPPVA